MIHFAADRPIKEGFRFGRFALDVRARELRKDGRRIRVQDQPFEVLVTLWIRGRWRLLFTLIALIIFLGSVITGWHYLIDSIAGVILAILCYLAVAIPQRRKAFLVANAPTD